MAEHLYQPVEDAFRDGKINEQSNENLSSFLIALSNEYLPNENVRHRDIIRGLTINHILLQRHIEGLNKQNSKTQRWVMALAVAALISSVVQIFSPVLFREQPIESIQSMLSTTKLIPYQDLPPNNFSTSHKENALNISYTPNPSFKRDCYAAP